MASELVASSCHHLGEGQESLFIIDKNTGLMLNGPEQRELLAWWAENGLPELRGF